MLHSTHSRCDTQASSLGACDGSQYCDSSYVLCSIGTGWARVRVRVSKLDEIEGENYVTQRDVIRELSS